EQTRPAWTETGFVLRPFATMRDAADRRSLWPGAAPARSRCRSSNRRRHLGAGSTSALPSDLADRPVAAGLVPTQAQSGPRRCGAPGGASLRLMRLRLSNPALIPDLVEFLRSRADVVAEEVSDEEVEVSLLGSYNSDAIRLERYLRFRAWQAGRRSTGAEIELVDHRPHPHT